MKKAEFNKSAKNMRVLNCLLRYGPQNYLEIERKIGMPNVAEVLLGLNARHLVVSQPKKRNLLKVYEITDAGQKFLDENDLFGKAPSVYRPVYTPLVIKEAPVREGSMRAFELKSVGF